MTCSVGYLPQVKKDKALEVAQETGLNKNNVNMKVENASNSQKHKLMTKQRKLVDDLLVRPSLFLLLGC
jgi:hypothetical protein